MIVNLCHVISISNDRLEQRVFMKRQRFYLGAVLVGRLFGFLLEKKRREARRRVKAS